MRKLFFALFALAFILFNSDKVLAQVGAQEYIVNPPNVGLTSGHVISAATTNSAVITGNRRVYKIDAFNTNAATAYLKLYNSAAAPTCNTATVLRTYPLVQNIQVDLDFPQGLAFPLGIGMCITAAIADNDNTAATTGIAVNFAYR